MKIHEYANFNRELGFSIKEVEGNYFHKRWIRRGDFPIKSPFPLISSFPDSYSIPVSRKLVNRLKWRSALIPLLLDAPKKSMYEFIISTDNYELEGFNYKARKAIRKSLRNCEFRRPDLEDLLVDGLRINRQTCKIQSRVESILTDQKKWKNYITSIHANPEFIIYGAYYQGILNGYLIAYKVEGKYNFLQAFIDRNHSSTTNPMNGLLYTMINHLIKKEGHVTVSYGMHKIKGPTPLNHFKRTMRFEAISVAKGYILNPMLLVLIKTVVFVHIKILNRHSAKRKWLRSAIFLYQGHRNLQSKLKQLEQEEFIQQEIFSQRYQERIPSVSSLLVMK